MWLRRHVLTLPLSKGEPEGVAAIASARPQSWATERPPSVPPLKGGMNIRLGAACETLPLEEGDEHTPRRRHILALPLSKGESEAVPAV